MFLLNGFNNKYFAMNTSFRVSLLYLLLIIPQHGNSPLPVMESWLQKDQDDGFVQRDMTSSLTGGDESFGSAHQTYQNSLIRKKKTDNSGNAIPGQAFRKFSSKFDRSQDYDPSNLFFNGRYMNKDYQMVNGPPMVNVDRRENLFEGFDNDPAIAANKYYARNPMLGGPQEGPMNSRFINKLRDEKNMAMYSNNRMNSFRGDGLQSFNDDIERGSKWAVCKRLKQRYAQNPLMGFSPSADNNGPFKYGENPFKNGYLGMNDDRENRLIRNQEFREAMRPDGNNPQIFGDSDYYDLDGNSVLGDEDMNVEDEDYNHILGGHSYMRKRDERNQELYDPQNPAAQVIIDALTSREALKSLSNDQPQMRGFQGGLTYNRLPKTREINNIPDSELVWKVNSDLQSKAISDVVRDSQRALQEVQLFQQKMSYKSPEGSDHEGMKRESRNQPVLKGDKKMVEFDEKRLKREDEDEQKNMKTGTDEGGGGEYEDEEGKGHKDEEEYYEEADLSDEESGNEVRNTERLNQKYVKREAMADSREKNVKGEQNDNSQDYELNFENAPVENAEKMKKSSYREGEKTKKNSVRKGVKIWDQWGKWSPCSVTCGVGRSTRWRHCIGGGCAQGEKEAQIKRCTNPACR